MRAASQPFAFSHEGEFSRLTGCALPIRDRLTAARDFARDHGCVLVLKGNGTVTFGARQNKNFPKISLVGGAGAAGEVGIGLVLDLQPGQGPEHLVFQVRSAVTQMQSRMNCPVVSCDIPSGVNADQVEIQARIFCCS